MAGYTDCVDREAAWFTTDTLPSFPGAPVLSTANGGPFDTIQGYLPDPGTIPPNRGLYIYTAGPLVRGSARSERVTMGGLGGMAYPFVAYVRWPYTGGIGDGLLESEMRTLNAAVHAVLARIRGPFGDKTHGGAFMSVGEIGGGLGGGLLPDIDIDPTDPQQAVQMGEPLEVRLHYTVVDNLFVQ